jgi:hypothetical protein
LAIIGLISFLFIQRAYDQFYARFGISPTEVGVDIYVVAYRAAYSLLLFGFLFLIVVMGVMETVAVVWRIATHQPGSRKTPWPSLKMRLSAWLSAGTYLPARIIVSILVFWLFALASFLLITLPISGLEDRIRRGESVETVTRITPLLWVRAERVRVDWVGPAEPALLPEGRPLTYLGSNEGIMIIYDLCEEIAVRVPAERVIVVPVEENVVDPNAC